MYIKNLVSIAIPAYKQRYLEETINSILSQDYNNIELIIINDCSPENLDEVVLKFDDTRIRYYKNNTNLGKKSIVYNWNKCLSYAKGEFFVLFCDDDIMYPNFISTLIKLTHKYPNCNVFKSRTITTYPNKNKYSPEVPELESFTDFLQYKLLGQRKHTISEFLYRTEYISKIKYTIYPIGFYSDDASILNFIKLGGIVSTNECLVEFRYSDINISFNNKLNFYKTKAAIQYYRDLSYNCSIKCYLKRINEIRDWELYDYFINSQSLYTALKILWIVPHKIWNLKIKIILLLKKLTS